MNNTLWNSKLKALFEKLSEEEQNSLVNFLNEFITYSEFDAKLTIKKIVVSPSTLALKHNVSEEILITTKSTLVSLYQQEHPECWLNNRQELDSSILSITSDYTFGSYISEIIESTLKKPANEITRILALLKKTETNNIYGGLVSMNFTSTESNFLIEYGAKVHNALNHKYEEFQKYISTPNNSEYISNYNEYNSITSTLMLHKDIKTLSETKSKDILNSNAINNLDKVTLLINRENILKFYKTIDWLKDKNLSYERLISKQDDVMNLLECIHI